MGGTLLERRWFVLFMASVVVTVCAMHFANRPRLSNDTGIIAARIDVGMSYDNVVAVLREHERGGGVYLYMNCRTHDGREFHGCYADALKNLPPTQELAWVEFNIMDDYSGRDLYITIESHKVVTELRLESVSIWEELRYGLALGTGWSGWKSLARERRACFECTMEHFFSADNH